MFSDSDPYHRFALLFIQIPPSLDESTNQNLDLEQYDDPKPFCVKASLRVQSDSPYLLESRPKTQVGAIVYNFSDISVLAELNGPSIHLFWRSGSNSIRF